MPEILIYSKSWCPFCQMAKQLLSSKGRSWTEIDVEEQPERVAEMVELTGRRTVPQIFIGERHVGGFDDMASLDASGELDRLLSA